MIFCGYPTSGCRVGYAGGLSDVGVRGFSWSNSPASSTSMNASDLTILSTSLFSEGSGNSRASGFPVRCVQE